MSDIPPQIPENVTPGVPPVPEPEPEPERELVPLERLPVPPYVLVVAVVAVIAFIIGLTRFPSALATAIDYEHGKKLVASGKAAEGVSLIEKTHQKFPKSIDVTLDLGEAYFQAGDYLHSAEALDSLAGTKATKEQSDRADQLASELKAKLDELEAAEKESQK